MVVCCCFSILCSWDVGASVGPLGVALGIDPTGFYNGVGDFDPANFGNMVADQIVALLFSVGGGTGFTGTVGTSEANVW